MQRHLAIEYKSLEGLRLGPYLFFYDNGKYNKNKIVISGQILRKGSIFIINFIIVSYVTIDLG